MSCRSVVAMETIQDGRQTNNQNIKNRSCLESDSEKNSVKAVPN